MNVIYEYYFSIQSHQRVELPLGARVLRVGTDPRERCALWALVDPEQPMVTVGLEVWATGEAHHGKLGTYVGTFNRGENVWHVFLSAIEKTSPVPSTPTPTKSK